MVSRMHVAGLVVAVVALVGVLVIVGVPFVGPAGSELERSLAAIQLSDSVGTLVVIGALIGTALGLVGGALEAFGEVVE